jgi:leucyl/phenylalanyl-tRNA--protein transferase
MIQPHWIAPEDPPDAFPPIERALRMPPGLLAAGGDLSQARLLAAYRRGIFPWYSAGQPILWWCPDPRAVLYPGELRVSRSLRKRVRHGDYRLRADTAFAAVVDGCAAPRPGGAGTWIDADMRDAYCALHAAGYAHSIEAWCGDELAGGLYGVALGGVFFGESMFSARTDASKVALLGLVRWMQRRGGTVIDCQLPNSHLESLGCRLVPRHVFLGLLRRSVAPEASGAWQLPPDLLAGDGAP